MNVSDVKEDAMSGQVISRPLCRCQECLAGGVETVDWVLDRVVEDFATWDCAVCGHRTVLKLYWEVAGE